MVTLAIVHGSAYVDFVGSEAHFAEHLRFIFQQSWLSMLGLAAAPILFLRDWSWLPGSPKWSRCRMNFARSMAAVALVIPPLLVFLAALWFNDHNLELLDNYDPYVPPWRFWAVKMLIASELIALGLLVVAGRGARLILGLAAILQALLIFFVWLTAVCAIGGDWL